MEYKVVLDSFQGPLDILLNLIEKAKIDIYDIPINIITEQYLDYISQMEEFDLELTSEFLLMASTLLQIKSKMLLPSTKEDDEEDERDPREELVLRLLAYKQYKEVASKLREYEEAGLKSFYKPQEDLTQFVDDDDLELGPLNIDSLFKALNKILERRARNLTSLNLEEITRDEFTIEECSESILQQLEFNKKIKFSELLHENSSKYEIVSYFLSLLELMRLKGIFVRQDRAFSDIVIIKNEVGAN